MVYDYGKLAEWAQKHRNQVDEMILTNGFCMGFQYNLAVCANTFQCNAFHQGNSVFPDISNLNEDMENQATNNTKAFNEMGLQESPYIAGGMRSNIDPWNDKGYQNGGAPKKNNTWKST
jgi:hypothetical protein